MSPSADFDNIAPACDRKVAVYDTFNARAVPMANEDRDYTNWLRSRPCCACGRGEVQVHHRTGAGMGLRAHDHDAMPLCFRCHSDLHCLGGKFAAFSREDLRSWQDEQIAALRAVYSPPAEVPGFDEATCF